MLLFEINRQVEFKCWVKSFPVRVCCGYWKFKQLIGYNLSFPFSVCVSTAELQMAEAVALVDTLQNWTVLDKIIIPTKNPDKKFVFGKGNFEALTGKKWDFSAPHLCRRKPSIAELFEDGYKHWGRLEDFF